MYLDNLASVLSPEDLAILRASGAGDIDLGLAGASGMPQPGQLSSQNPFTVTASPPTRTPTPISKPTFRDNVGTIGGAFDAGLGLTETAKQQTAGIGRGVKAASKTFGAAPTVAARNGRMAMAALRNPAVNAALKVAGPAAAALALGDVVIGDESLGNKAMDLGMMAAGGAVGSIVPVVGTALGAGVGKMVSDGTQWLFGDKKTPEQRKMELALAQLQGSGVV